MPFHRSRKSGGGHKSHKKPSRKPSAQSMKSKAPKRSGSKKSKKEKKKSKTKMQPGQVYCVRCKCGVKPGSSSEKKMKNGACMVKGTCPKCSGKVNGIKKC